MLATHAMTNVAISQGSLSHCCCAVRLGRRTDCPSAVLKTANGTVAFDSRAFVTGVLAEDEPDAGNSGDTCFVLVTAGDSMVTTDSCFSSTDVLLEDEPDACRCKPCLVFSQ